MTVVTNVISAIDDFFLLELIICWLPMHLYSSPEYISVTYLQQQNDTLLILTLLRDSHFLLDWWGPNVPICPIILLWGEGKSVLGKKRKVKSFRHSIALPVWFVVVAFWHLSEESGVGVWWSTIQGYIFRLTCSHPELTEDHVLTSAYVKIFRTGT